MGKKKVIILGCTGSIGKNSLDIVRSHPDKFEVTGLSAHKNEELLTALADEFPGSVCALAGTDGPAADRKITYFGEEGLLTMVRETEADIVVNGIAGAKGLLSSIASLESDKDLALANKETIVMAGKLILELAEKKGKKVLPVDSEHSALFFLTQSVDHLNIEELVLTASGGAFRDLPKEQLTTVSLEDALKHPTWQMGKKITVDSATLANKGLEVIEAHLLFSMPPEKIKVVIHPQSCIHSLVRTREGSLYAQISKPDMRLPIQNALTYPETVPCPFGGLNLPGLSLSFLEVDTEKYPMLPLAYESIKAGGTYPVAYNAANEIAVAAFLEGGLSFVDIPKIVEKTIERSWPTATESFDQVLDVDARSREAAENISAEITKV